MTRILFLSAVLAMTAACAHVKKDEATMAPASAPAASSTTAEATEMTKSQADPVETNVLLAEFEGPYGGVPAFDRMDLVDLEQALTEGMALHLKEIDAIASRTDDPTFENTIVALEAAGAPLQRAFRYYGIWSNNLSSPEFRGIQKKMSPKMAQYRSRISQNAELFARVKAVYEGDEMSGLSGDQQRLVKLRYDQFARNGATLQGEDKKRYAEINERLAELHTEFGNNVLADEQEYVLYLDENQLSGLSESFVAGAASAAASRGHEGKYAVTNTRSSMDPFLAASDERELREKVWRTYYSRGDNGDDNDNNEICAEILQLRHERVQLLGFENYASWRLENRMAKAPEHAMELMNLVWPAAVARVEEEVADMQAIADAEGAGITIEPWDYRYYAEKVRKAKYDLDSEAVSHYLQLDNLRDAMFFVAGELFAFEFTPVPAGTVPVFHEDVTVWDVTNRDSGDHIGLWYLDPFARPGKRSGAWATTYRGHESYNGKTTVLSSNNSNFIKGTPGEPVLISFDDAETLFHEFGHALHFLSSRAAYPTLDGGVRDYTEFQSQLLERWVLTDEVIDNYLVHYETGEPMPDEMVAKIKAAANFNQGFKTTEYLASALLDMAYHSADPTGIDIDAFERETLAELGLPSELVMRHRSPHFGHIFSGEGYSAGYYGYMWADVLTADATEAFVESPGGFYDPDMATKLVDHLFAPRNSIDPGEAYRAFRGRDADTEALMRDRGFPVPGKSSD